jgi:RNA-directed DNA polymerase
VPTISDRIGQMVVKNRLEAVVDPLFLPASYGYRPGLLNRQISKKIPNP